MLPCSPSAGFNLESTRSKTSVPITTQVKAATSSRPSSESAQTAIPKSPSHRAVPAKRMTVGAFFSILQSHLLSDRRTYQSISLLIILFSFALRVHHLGARSLWFDESVEYWVASAPLSQILSAAKTALQDPPLYSLLLHVWRYAGHAEFSIRFLSVTFSVLGVLGTLSLARIALGRTESLIAGLLIAVSIPNVRFAQEAGQYALMSCLLIWNLVFLYLLVKRQAWRWSVLWVISGVAAIYSYYGTMLTIGATTLVCVVYLIAQRRHDQLRRLVVSAGIMGLLSVPLAVEWMPVQLFRSATAGAFKLVMGTSQEELHRWAMQTKSLLIFMLLGYQKNNWPWPQLQEWMLWLPLVFLVLIGTIRKRYRLLISWFLIGSLVYYLVGRAGAYPYGGRYALILEPLLWCAVAAGISVLASRLVWSIRGFVVVVILSAFVALGLLAPIEAQEDLRTAARFWSAHRQTGEATYVYYGAVPGFRYQIALAGYPEALPPLWYMDCWQGEPFDYCNEGGIHYGRWIRNLAPEAKVQALLDATGDATQRLWLIFSHIYGDEDQTILTALNPTYRVVMRHSTENSAAILLERQ